MEDIQFKLSDFKETGIKEFNWHDYNNSQTKEKLFFFRLLDELCSCIEPEKEGSVGRRPASFAHQIFCMCLKTYLGMSSRRLISDLEVSKQAGYIDVCPCFNSVLNYFNNSSLKSVLKYLIELSALPLAQLERKFAVDSTGFSLHQYEPWIQAREHHKTHRKYKKAHIIYGVLSNIAVSCSVTEGNKADSPQFQNLLKRAANNFIVDEITADKAYSSRENLRYASELGSVAYIPFKDNATGNSKGCMVWKRMYEYFKKHNEEFLRHYHLRSNAETGFWMIKQKFGEFVKSKNEVSQENEVLCKVLCHNICCLIQEIFLQKIEVNFLDVQKLFVAQQ